MKEIIDSHDGRLSQDKRTQPRNKMTLMSIDFRLLTHKKQFVQLKKKKKIVKEISYTYLLFNI